MIIEPIQSNFSAGEISPKLRSQTGAQVVSQGVKLMDNMIPETHGDANGRYGTIRREVNQVSLGDNSNGPQERGRVFTFNVDIDDQYIVIIAPVDSGSAPSESEIIVYDADDFNNSGVSSPTPEIFEVGTVTGPTGTVTYADDNNGKVNTPYNFNDIQDIHFVQVKDQIIFVHGDHPPMRLIRYRRQSDGAIRWSFTFMGTFGAQWGDGLSLTSFTFNNSTDVIDEIGFPRTIAYHQQRIVYGGFIRHPNRLVFSRADDFNLIDTGYTNTRTHPVSSWGEGQFTPVITPQGPETRIISIYGSYTDRDGFAVRRNVGKNGPKTLVRGTDYEVVFSYEDESQYTPYMTAQDISATYNLPQEGYRSRFDLSRPSRAWIELTDPLGDNEFIEIAASRPEDSGLFFDIASTTQDTIQWLAVGDSLFIGTTGSEWVAGVNQYISAVNPPSFQQVSSYGSSHIQPISIGDATVYVTANGRELRAFRTDYNANREKWDNIELSWQAQHFFEDYKIREIAYSQSPSNILWVLTDNGQLFSAVYEPNVKAGVGWSRHSMSSDVRNITNVSDQLYDKLLMVNTRRRAFEFGGQFQTTERRTFYEIQGRDFDMDSITFFESGAPLTSIDLSNTVAGISQVDIFNNDIEVVVAIKVDGALEFQGTYTELAATGRLDANGVDYTLAVPGRFVEVGIPFSQRIYTNDLDYSVQGSDYSKRKRQTKVFLDLIESQPPKVNGTRNSDRTTATLMGNLEPPIDGKVKYNDIGHSRNQIIEIEQDAPFRLNLCAIFGRANMGTES